MKKVFALMLAAGVFAVVACGEGKKADSSADSAAVVDSAQAVADSAQVVADSAQAVVDSAKAVVDSAKAH